MANITCELVWIWDLSELHLLPSPHIETILWQKVAIHIAKKSCLSWAHQAHWGGYLVCQKVVDYKIIETRYVANQLANLLTKPVGGLWVRFICVKLCMYMYMLKLKGECWIILWEERVLYVKWFIIYINHLYSRRLKDILALIGSLESCFVCRRLIGHWTFNMRS